MKVLFLDCDGVINCAKTFTKDMDAFFPVDKYMSFLVGKIQMDTNCEIVLSSSWRHHQRSVDLISKRLFKLLDITGDSDDGFRGKEIKTWLDAHPEVTRYAILDDDSDMLPEQLPNFFKTSWQEGITDEIAKKVTEHLNKNTTD